MVIIISYSIGRVYVKIYNILQYIYGAKVSGVLLIIFQYSLVMSIMCWSALCSM